MVKIVKKIVSESKYNIKCPYKMDAKYITVHNTANDASADAEIKYMHKTEAQGGRQVSYHYAVDDTRAVQGINLNQNAWHAGKAIACSNK